MPTHQEIVSALSQAITRPVVAERPIGCCRVYVSVPSDIDAKAVAKAAKALSLIWQKRGHYGTRNVLYVGYDNCGGRELAKGSAIVAALASVGVKAFREEHGD